MSNEQKEVISQFCKMMGRISAAVDPNGEQRSDCVCAPDEKYKNDGHVLELMEEAVSAIVSYVESPDTGEERRGQRVASNFCEEHLPDATPEVRAQLAKWFQKHAEATRVKIAVERLPLVGVACKDIEGRIWTLPKPFRHHHILWLMKEHGTRCAEDNHYSQGFVDEMGRYLNRHQAHVNAHLHGQIKDGKIIGGVLTSEDLW